MSVISQALKDDLVDPQHIIPIDFNSIKQVPESHAWIDQINLDHNNKEKLRFIPIIDLEDPNLGLLFHACETWGVFQITNHGVPKQVIEKVEYQTKRLFSLPLEEKMKVLRAPNSATGYGSPKIAPLFSKLMWTEGFTIIGDSMVNHAMELWPNEYQEFCVVMDQYQRGMKELGDKLMSLFLKSLSIPETTAYWAKHDPTCDRKNIYSALQLNSYPTCPNPTQTIGLAPHTDSMFFTILHQSANANGLQLFKDGLGWVPLNPDRGALVVNVGDLLHILSNARFHSVLHRAVVNNDKHRISVAYFYAPPFDFEVCPFVDYPKCEGPCYRSLEVKEYVGIKAKKFDSALSSIRI